MDLKKLKVQAQKILDLEPSAKGFKSISFKHGSLGSPSIEVEDIEPVRSYEEKSYKTIRFGWMYKGEVTIECEPTGIRDANDRMIYRTPENKCFVYLNIHGSPEFGDAQARIVRPAF